MVHLENAELSVAILDPATDLDRCGSRYCVGGYIYQVTDAHKGELLSGPEYPNPRPNLFDGQGAPDQFVTVLGADAPVGGEVGVIGVGRVRRSSPLEPFQVRHNPEVIEFLPWQVTKNAGAIRMQTEQTFNGWGYRLTRELKLAGRTVDSRTSIENQGQPLLPVRWFAHPFFPLTADRVCCRLSTRFSLPENPGYVLNAEGYICQKPDYAWSKGCFQALEYARTGTSMTLEERHPAAGTVTAVTDFMPDWLPVWSNAVTFSFEPYFIRELAPGETATWSIRYQF
jgi:hypothetical protein